MADHIKLWPLIKKLEGAHIYKGNTRYSLEETIRIILNCGCFSPQKLARELKTLLLKGKVFVTISIYFTLRGPKWPNSKRNGYKAKRRK